MRMDSSRLFREIALLKNESLLVENHVIIGKITDINKEGWIVYTVKEQSVFHTAGMEKHGTIFFDAMGESCFVHGRMFFKPPEQIITIPLGPIGVNKRVESRINTPALPSFVMCRYKIFRKKIKATVVDICLRGASILTHDDLKECKSHTIVTNFPFHNTSLPFSASFDIRHSERRHDLFIYGTQFTSINKSSETNIKKYIERMTT